MGERGNYQDYIRPDTPSEAVTRSMFGTAPTNPTGATLLIVGSMAVIGVLGVIGLVMNVVEKKALPAAPPATPFQKVLSVGLLGAAVGTGAYVYFSDAERDKRRRTPDAG